MSPHLGIALTFPTLRRVEEFFAESAEAHLHWLSQLCDAATSRVWPGGLGGDGVPLPLSYSQWEAGQAAGGALPPVPPFPLTPPLQQSLAWRRKSLLLQRLRACSLVFEDAAPCSEGGGGRGRRGGGRRRRRSSAAPPPPCCCGLRCNDSHAAGPCGIVWGRRGQRAVQG